MYIVVGIHYLSINGYMLTFCDLQFAYMAHIPNIQFASLAKEVITIMFFGLSRMAIMWWFLLYAQGLKHGSHGYG